MQLCEQLTLSIGVSPRIGTPIDWHKDQICDIIGQPSVWLVVGDFVCRGQAHGVAETGDIAVALGYNSKEEQ